LIAEDSFVSEDFCVSVSFVGAAVFSSAGLEEQAKNVTAKRIRRVNVFICFFMIGMKDIEISEKML
jgi:hypothetical protein